MGILLIPVMLVAAGYVTFLARRIFCPEGLIRVPSAAGWLLSLVPAVLCGAALPLTGSLITAALIIMHLAGLAMVFDIVQHLFRRRITDETKRRGAAFAAAFVLCLAYIVGAAINASVVTPTRYELTTGKEMGRDHLRIAHISDVHLGTTFDAEGFARHLELIEAHEPDMLVITGDLVDGDTSRADMLAACEAIGSFEVPLGVYFVPGNHEDCVLQGELYRALEAEGVTVLVDRTVTVDGLHICGRADAYYRGRKPVSELMPEDTSGYIIVLNHQPGDYASEAAAGADLVLSGHTHGGQMLPLTFLMEPLGLTDNVYGRETNEGTEFIVTSGMSCFEVPLRTGVKTEYVIIDITAA